MSDHIAIEQIVIKIGKKKLELSAQEAKELKDVLNSLLGHPVVINGTTTWIYYPQPYIPITYPNWTTNVTNGTLTLNNTNYNSGASLPDGGPSVPNPVD
jgi:hypothetical protein